MVMKKFLLLLAICVERERGEEERTDKQGRNRT